MNNLSRKKISGYIDHEYKGRKVRLHGDVIGVNESDMTAKMKFDNGVISDGIPMEVIQLDEGVFDRIKKGANRAWGYVKGQFQKIGGKIRKMINGEPIPFNRASNIGQLAAEGGLPAGVGFYPSDEAIAEADEVGVNITEVEAPESAEVDSNGFNEIATFNKLWRMFIEKSKLEESESKVNLGAQGAMDSYIQAVNEMYGADTAQQLAHNPSIKDFFGIKQSYKSLCEDIEYNAVQQLMEGGDWTMKSRESENMPDRTMREIVREIMLQLKARYQTGEFDFSSKEGKAWLRGQEIKWANAKMRELRKSKRYDFNDPEQYAEAKRVCIRFASEMADGINKKAVSSAPLMIWGAPGIGKTTIVQQCRAMFKKATQGTGSKESKVKNGYNINMLEIVLSKMSSDDFTLPGKGEDKITGEQRAVNGIQSWIPCWEVSGDYELDKLRDMAANYKMNTANVLAQHGMNVTDIRDTIDSFKQGANRAVKLQSAATKGKGSRLGADGQIEKIDYITGYRPIDDNREGVDDEGNNVMRSEKEFSEEILKASKGRGRKKRSSVSDIVDGKVTESWKIYENDEIDDFNDGNYDQEKDDQIKYDDTQEDIDNLTDGGIIFFDELTRAPKGVMNVIMNLINDRKVGEGWVLGSHWSIVCAGNRFWEMTEISSTWEKAFGTRFQNVTFVPTYEDWKKWAQGYVFDANTGEYTEERGEQKIDQYIIDYLDNRRMVTHTDDAWYENIDKDANQTGADADDAAVTYANPRTWQRVSDAMVKYAIEKARRNGIENPEKGDLYSIDDKGNYYLNLSSDEKDEIAKNNIGMGSASLKGFVNYGKMHYFKETERKNVVNNGCIKGKPTELTKLILETGKSGDVTFDGNEALKNQYLPKDESGFYVHLMTETITALIREIFDKLDWKHVTNIQIANILSYAAILFRMEGNGNETAFKQIYQSIFYRLMKMYHSNHSSVPAEIADALESAIDGKDPERKKYIQWLSPAKYVYLFVFSWEGQRSEKSINAELESALADIDIDTKIDPTLTDPKSKSKDDSAI